MVALRLWVVSEGRRRWASLLLVATIVAVGGGAVLLSLNGAQRADTAFERFYARVGAPNVEAEASLPESGDLGRFTSILDRLDEIDDLPGVERAFVSAWMLVGVKGQPTGYFTPVPIAATDTSDAWQSVVVEGRLPARDEADTIVVNEEAARVADVGVGDRLTLESLAPGQGLEYLSGEALPEPRGPSVAVTIVGVVRGAEDISDTPEAYWAPGEGFYRAYGDQIETCVCRVDVRAEAGRQGEVVAAVAEIVEPLGFSVRAGTGADLARRLEHATSVEANLLRLAAALAAGAGLLLLVLALLRQEAELSNELQVRRALGLGPRWHAMATAALILPFALLGVVGAVGLTAVLSPLLPQGRARRAEVDPGVWLDAPLVLAGAVLMVVVVLLCAALVGWVTATRSAARSAPPARRAVPGLVGAMPVPASLGVRFAVDPGRGRLRIASLSGLAGVALAVAAVAGVATLRSSTDRLVGTPALYGATHDLVIWAGEDLAALGPRVAALDGVGQVSLVRNLGGAAATVEGPTGQTGASPEAYEPLRGALGPVVLEGRAAGAPDETVLGPGLAGAIGARVGDQMSVLGIDGKVSFRVVGLAVQAGNDELDQGLTVTTEGLSRICQLADDPAACQPSASSLVVDVAEGTPIEQVRASLDDLTASDGTSEIEVVLPPSIVRNLADIGAVPVVLAVLLAGLGVAGLAHGLLVALRRRRRDIGVARALGFTTGQAAATLAWQAAVVALAGSLIGLLGGLIAGRLLWGTLARGIHAFVEVSVPVAVFALPIVAVAVALVVSIAPGLRAAHLRPSDALRAE
jgi:ABC-type lipoprotein release transport system permease subunit